MFEKQLKKLREKIHAAGKIRNFDKSADAYTRIITEKLETKAKVDIQAILFLDSDAVGNVYYSRSFSYEKIAIAHTKNNDLGEAQKYYRLASSDTVKALEHYEDLDEKNKCRTQLKEDKEKLTSLSNKRKRTEEILDNTSEETRPTQRTSTRLKSIWTPQEKEQEAWDKTQQEHQAYYGRSFT
jgi:hypothetical protein